MLRFLIPLAVFVVLVGFLWAGLSLKPREVPSPLIDKPAPAFALSRLDNPQQSVTPQDLRGKCGCSTCGRRGASPAWTSIRYWSSSPGPARCRSMV